MIFIEYSTPKHQSTHFSQVHTKYSPGLTTCWAIRQALVNLRKLKSYQVGSAHIIFSIDVVQSLSHIESLRPYGLQHARLPCPSLPPGVCSCPLLKLMSIESMMLSNHLILCCPLLLLESILPSIRVFSNELTLLIR